MTFIERVREEIRGRPRVAALASWALTSSMRASSWMAHIGRVPASTEPDLIARHAFREDFRRFAAANDGRLALRWQDRYPLYEDRTASVPFEPHYLYHTAWAARCLERIGPERHVDVSSSLRFVTTVSAFVDVDYYEYRPTVLNGLSRVTSHQGDLLALPFADDSVVSLSCLHVIEHIGLGRYGDPVDPTADRRALAELRRVLAPGGNLLIAMPVGPPRIRFNAHRVYSFDLVVDQLPGLELVEFALVLEDGSGLITGDAARRAVPHQTESLNAGTGCFWLRKPL